MLQVGVDHPKDVRSGVLPAVEHRTAQTPLSREHQQAHARVGFRDFLYDGVDSVAAVVVYYNDFISDAQRVEAPSDAIEQEPYVLRFAKGWHHDGQFRHRSRRRGDPSIAAVSRRFDLICRKLYGV